MELEKIQRDRENHLKTIKSDYENFQVSKVLIISCIYIDVFVFVQMVIQKSIDKIDYGEKRIQELRDKFLSEIISFNRDFNFPKEKIEELFKRGKEKI